MRRRLIATWVLALAVTVGSTGVAAAQTSQGTGGEADNAAVAVNTKDGTDLFRLAFSIDRIMNGTTDPTNAAVAYASCESCKTTAIAIQVVIMTSPPTDTSQPENLALAINDQCTSCETVALAYQIVLQTDGPVKLSKEGKQKVKDILQQISDLQNQDLSPDELDAATSALVDQLQQVLNEELQPKDGETGQATEDEFGDQDTTDQLPSPDMTTSPTDSVDFGDSPSPSATESPLPSDTPVDSATPAPAIATP